VKAVRSRITRYGFNQFYVQYSVFGFSDQLEDWYHTLAHNLLIAARQCQEGIDRRSVCCKITWSFAVPVLHTNKLVL